MSDEVKDFIEELRVPELMPSSVAKKVIKAADLLEAQAKEIEELKRKNSDLMAINAQLSAAPWNKSPR